MLVADASAVIGALLNARVRGVLAGDLQVHAPHLMDSEIASAIRRRARTGRLDSRAGWELLERYRRLGIMRHSTFPMFERMWELRDNLSAMTRRTWLWLKPWTARYLLATRGSVGPRACGAS